MTQTDAATVRRQVVVDAPIERAFSVFTDRFGDFKPPEHNLLGAPITETVFEPRVGGGIVDRAADGSECTILVNTNDNSYQFCNAVCAAINSVLEKFPGSHEQVVTVPSLAGLYEEINQRAPHAEIRVLLYPHLFPKDPPVQCVAGFPFGLDKTEMKAINDAGDSLDGIISTAVTAAQGKKIDIQLVDARQAFVGHEECSAAPWFNGLILHPLPSPYSFHPNAQGQKEFAALLQAKL